jgi:hypothetical protein
MVEPRSFCKLIFVSPKKKFALVLVLPAMLLVAGIILRASMQKAEVPFTKGLQKNGYDTFVRAAAFLHSDGSTVRTNDYPAFLMTNRQALAIVREGLKLRAELPAKAYERAGVWEHTGLQLDDLSLFKGLSNALKVEGQHAEIQQRYGDAANTYLDIIRLGQKVEAGLLIHFLVGLALENTGLRALEQIEPHLPPSERARVAAELKALQRSRLTFAEILNRERFYMRRNSATPLHYFVGLYMTRAAVAKSRAKHEAHGAELARVAEKFAP